jgi:8-oxo-dGTP pyrophosphatase MutT (NUDIX family)
MSGIIIVPVDRLALRFAPKPWAFAHERRAEIDACFEALRRDKPALWNGRVLLLHRQVISDGVFSGDYLETDYASFSAWIRWGRQAAGVHDCFGAAAILSADGAFLLGRMGAHTFNAGQIYFPSGTPDPDDVIDGRVDLDASVRRELKEEIGLELEEFVVEPGWATVVDGRQIALIKVLRSPMSADELRVRILGNMARQRQPELADICIVRGLADLDPAMRPFIKAFLSRHFGGG